MQINFSSTSPEERKEARNPDFRLKDFGLKLQEAEEKKNFSKGRKNFAVTLRKQKKHELLKQKRRELKLEIEEIEEFPLELFLSQKLHLTLQQLKLELTYLRVQESDLALISEKLQSFAERSENELFLCLFALGKLVKKKYLKEELALPCANQVYRVMAFSLHSGFLEVFNQALSFGVLFSDIYQAKNTVFKQINSPESLLLPCQQVLQDLAQTQS